MDQVDNLYNGRCLQLVTPTHKEQGCHKYDYEDLSFDIAYLDFWTFSLSSFSSLSLPLFNDITKCF